MKKRTDAVIAGLYGAGLLVMIGTMIVIRLRIDRILELTV